RGHLAHASTHVLLQFIIDDHWCVNKAASMDAPPDIFIETQDLTGQQHRTVKETTRRTDVYGARAGFSLKTRLITGQNRGHVNRRELLLGDFRSDLINA